jgi:hypothetical protein
MKPYEPRIHIEGRRGRKSVFIEMPDGRRHNIIDVDRPELPTVIRAAARAFNLGLAAQKIVMGASHVREFDVFYVDDVVRVSLDERMDQNAKD